MGKKFNSFQSKHDYQSIRYHVRRIFSFVEPSKGKDSIDFESNGTLPYQNIIKLLQEINASEQKKMLEIIKQLIEWKNYNFSTQKILFKFKHHTTTHEKSS